MSTTTADVFKYIFNSHSISILGETSVLKYDDEDKLKTIIYLSASSGVTVINLSEGEYFSTICKMGLGPNYPVISVMVTEYDIKTIENYIDLSYYYYMTITPDKEVSRNNDRLKERLYDKIGRRPVIDINIIAADAVLSTWQTALANAVSRDVSKYQKYSNKYI